MGLAGMAAWRRSLPTRLKDDMFTKMFIKGNSRALADLGSARRGYEAPPVQSLQIVPHKHRCGPPPRPFTPKN